MKQKSYPNQFQVISVLAIIISVVIYVEAIEAAYVWNWDSGTTEGWLKAKPDTTVSIETGRNGTFGLGAEDPVFPEVMIEAQFIDPGLLVGGQFGFDLTMTGQLYVDVDREILNSHGEYLRIQISDGDSQGGFLCYPYDNYGSVEDLGDGWFRHYFENSYHADANSQEATGDIYLAWNWVGNTTGNPVVFDNLTIIPEPATILLLALGAIALRKTTVKI